MAIAIYENGPSHGLKTYICDEDKDVENLPTNVPIGCIAYIIDNEKIFIINNDKEWVEQCPEAPVGPFYTGTTEVTTQDEDIVLETTDKLLEQDITIHHGHEIEDALISNTSMNEYYNDRVTSIGVNGQQGTNFQCTQIKKITLPSIEHCPAQYAFLGRNVSLLEELYTPRLIDSGYGFAENNPNLKIIDFGLSFGGAKCRSCPNLDTIIIRNPAPASVGNAHLAGTKLASDGTGGYVYVPQNLLSQYQADTTWQTYANVLEFRPIEGSKYELNE